MSAWFVTYGYGEVHRDLVIGAYPLDAGDVRMLQVIGVDRVLNLVQDAEYEPGDRAEIEQALLGAGIEETRVSLIDFGGLPAEQIEQAVATVAGWLRAGHRVYVHCRAGWQRSAAVAAGAIAVLEQIPISDALAAVKARKPTADPLPHQRTDLESWWAQREPRSAD
jgi:protein-tyrosine phosphatase